MNTHVGHTFVYRKPASTVVARTCKMSSSTKFCTFPGVNSGEEDEPIRVVRVATLAEQRETCAAGVHFENAHACDLTAERVSRMAPITAKAHAAARDADEHFTR